MNRDAAIGRPLFERPVLLAAAFSLFLWGLVLFLNWLGPSEIPVAEAQFRRLHENHLVAAIAIGQEGLHCRLVRRVRVANMGQEFLTEDVFVPRGPRVPDEEAQVWSASGIAVTHGRPEAGRRNLAGLLVVGGLLALGLWHLWSQVQMDRHGQPSPRRRLRELEAEYRAGRIGGEEYQRQVEAVSAEL